MAPATFRRWTQRVNRAKSLRTLERVAAELRQLPEEDDQANLFLYCTLRRLELHQSGGRP